MGEDKRTELCERMATALPVLRKAMGITQAQFAGITGVTRNTIIHIERKRSMGWQSYLSFLMIFSKHKDTKALIEAFHLYPAELDEFLTGGEGEAI